MKTIKDVAETVNVSKTSIYNLIKKHNIPTVKQDGKTFLDENGESLVRGYYNIEQHETISDIITAANTFGNNNGYQDDFQEDFQEDSQDSKLLEYTQIINVLENERIEKNKIIQELIQSNKLLSQALAADKLNEAARLMLKGGIYNTSGKETEPNKKKGLFSRLFKKK